MFHNPKAIYRINSYLQNVLCFNLKILYYKCKKFHHNISKWGETFIYNFCACSLKETSAVRMRALLRPSLPCSWMTTWVGSRSSTESCRGSSPQPSPATSGKGSHTKYEPNSSSLVRKWNQLACWTSWTVVIYSYSSTAIFAHPTFLQHLESFAIFKPVWKCKTYPEDGTQGKAPHVFGSLSVFRIF